MPQNIGHVRDRFAIAPLREIGAACRLEPSMQRLGLRAAPGDHAIPPNRDT
jgi:hypothetical protein